MDGIEPRLWPRVQNYGIYDTETIEKVVKLVVTLEFKIGN